MQLGLVDVGLIAAPLAIILFLTIAIAWERRRASAPATVASGTRTAEPAAAFDAAAVAHDHREEIHRGEGTDRPHHAVNGSVMRARAPGTKKIRSTELKAQMRQHREWQVANHRETMRRKQLLALEQQDVIDEREAQILKERDEERRLESIRRQQQEEEIRLALEIERSKPRPQDTSEQIHDYFIENVYCDFKKAAADLNLRYQELHDFLRERQETRQWICTFDESGSKFLLLDTECVNMLQDEISEKGVISVARIEQILTSHQVN